VPENSNDLQMRVLQNVPVPLAILKCPLESILVNKTLCFSGDAAGKPTSVLLSFRTDIDLAAGEVITLTLPRFTRSGTCLVHLTVPENLFSTVSWIGEELALPLARDVASGKQIYVTLPLSAGFVLPADGVKELDKFTLATDAARAAVPGSLISDFNKVGLIKDASLTYSSCYSSCCLQMISFMAKMKISPLGTITVSLPGFGYDLNQVTELVLYNTSKYLSNRVMVSNSGSVLIFSVTKSIPENTLLSIDVSNFENPRIVSLPDALIEANSSSLTVAISSALGSVSATPFATSPGCGFFIRKPYLSFEPPRAGFPAVATITFIPAEEITAYSTLHIFLPGFKTATDGTFTLDDTSSVAALTDVQVNSGDTSVHNSVTSTTLGISLVFTFGEIVEAGGRVSVSLGNNVSLSLPLTGLDSNTTITARLIRDGGDIVVQCSFASIRGMTASHRIKFDPLVPGQATAIEFSWQLSTAMKEYETVFLSLPNFGGSTKEVPISGSSARYFSAFWSHTCGATSAHLLMLVVKQGAIIRPYESLNIVVESLGGISLPERGLPRNTVGPSSSRRLLQSTMGISLWIDSAGGIPASDSQSIDDFSGVGSFAGTEDRKSVV
jgi:hypothetical protein